MWLKRWLRFGQPGALRLVVDTNVLISGTIVPTGASARIVDAALESWLYLITCPVLLTEYADVLHVRPCAWGSSLKPINRLNLLNSSAALAGLRKSFVR